MMGVLKLITTAPSINFEIYILCNVFGGHFAKGVCMFHSRNPAEPAATAWPKQPTL